MNAKASCIHVSDKLSMTLRFTHDVAGLDIEAENDWVVFVGGSPNDAPLFGRLRHACGVAGIGDAAGRLEPEPAYVTEGGGGRGFVEVAERLLAARARGR